MYLSRFNLAVIRNALEHMIYPEKDGYACEKSDYKDTESVICDIIAESRTADFFLVQPDELEEWE